MLSTKGSWEFKSLFELVHANLRSKGFTGGGEEMLRLRAHEKLQKFLHSGVVTKTGKEYTGVPKALVNFFKMAEELKAKVEIAIQNRTALQSSYSGTTASEQTKAPTSKAKAERKAKAKA